MEITPTVPAAINWLAAAVEEGVDPDIFMSLTRKQRLFVEYYLASFNARQAAQDAGYEGKTAGSTLLRKSYISKAIDACMSLRIGRIQVTQDHVIAELCKIGFQNSQDYVSELGHVLNPHQMSREKASVIKKYKTKTTFEGKGDARHEVEHIEVEFESKLSALKILYDHFNAANGFASNARTPNTTPIGDDIEVDYSTIEIIGVESGTYFPPLIEHDENEMMAQ